MTLAAERALASHAILRDGPPPPPPPPPFVTPRMICDHLVGLTLLTSEQQAVADLNQSGEIDIGDVVAMVNKFNLAQEGTK